MIVEVGIVVGKDKITVAENGSEYSCEVRKLGYDSLPLDTLDGPVSCDCRKSS